MTENEKLRRAFRRPTDADTATPLAYLKYLESVFRRYAANAVTWQDARETLRTAPDIIAGFEDGDEGST